MEKTFCRHCREPMPAGATRCCRCRGYQGKYADTGDPRFLGRFLAVGFLILVLAAVLALSAPWILRTCFLQDQWVEIEDLEQLRIENAQFGAWSRESGPVCSIFAEIRNGTPWDRLFLEYKARFFDAEGRVIDGIEGKRLLTASPGQAGVLRTHREAVHLPDRYHHVEITAVRATRRAD